VEGVVTTMASARAFDQRETGPFLNGIRVVALGGGTGLPNVLRGLCLLLYGGAARKQDARPTDQLVAIVTTTDDGGSSGRLRREFGIIPPGDIRNCLAALAEDQSLLTALFQFRFAAGEGLKGHALGNLMLTALAEVTGDFTRAVELAGRVVGARGRVMPATMDQMTLSAELLDGRNVLGETAMTSAGTGIRRLSIMPSAPRCVDGALEALRRADVIVAGPGSLYTSVLAPLLVPEMMATIRNAEAARVFVLNLMTEPGETTSFDAPRHLEVIEEHLGFQPFDHVIFNTAPVPPHLVEEYAKQGSTPITVTTREINAIREMGIKPLGAPLACEGPGGRIRHHPGRLAAAVIACDRFGRV
jgi:uncharacterized cofD-like protein